MSDFETIKKNCLKRRELFEDPTFKASQCTVFYHQTPPFEFVWKRPKELCPSPVFVHDGSTHFDVVPGKLGDRWFVSCIGCLTLTRGLFYRVVPADQSFGVDDYAGIFRFRIWWCGEWQEVVIDDRLPTVNNKLVFVHSQHSNQFWASLLEKAYAKLHGSYEALKYGCSQDGLSDMTGGVTESVNIFHDPTACIRVIGRLLQTTSVVTALVHQPSQVQSRNQAEKLANGILLGINYRIGSIEKVETKGGDLVQLVRLRNPLCVPEYVGAWGRESEEWLQVKTEDRDRLNNRSMAEGEFWIPYQDFLKTFTNLEIVHLDAETSKDEASLRSKSPWNMKLWHSSWQKGVSAGGCRNNSDTFHINPQFQLILPDSCDVIISLSQHSVLEPKVIGFTVYQASKLMESVGRAFFKRNKSFLNSQYSNSRQISNRCAVEQGNYMIIPTTFEAGHEASFTLRVYCNKSVRLKVSDCTPGLLKPAILKAPPNFENKIGCYEAIFLQVADEQNKSVNAFDLQELLEACLPNDYVKSCATLEVCRQVILAFDSTNSGRLKFADYRNLICSLKYWQNIFKNHTKGTAGILRSEKLKDALMEVGFQLNTETLSLLVLRYMRKDGTLRFGDFVSCILHLSVAFGMFEKKDPLQNGYIKMNLNDWLKATLQC